MVRERKRFLDHLQSAVDFLDDRAEKIGSQLEEEPRQEHLEPVAEVGLVRHDQLRQGVQEQGEHLRVGVHKHPGEDLRDPPQFGGRQHAAVAEIELKPDETVLPVCPVGACTVRDDVGDVLHQRVVVQPLPRVAPPSILFLKKEC